MIGRLDRYPARICLITGFCIYAFGGLALGQAQQEAETGVSRSPPEAAKALHAGPSIDSKEKALSWAKIEGNRHIDRAVKALDRAKSAATASKPLAESLSTAESQRQLEAANNALKEIDPAVAEARNRADRAIRRVGQVLFNWEQSDTDAVNVELNQAKEAADKAVAAAGTAERAKSQLESLVKRKEDDNKAQLDKQKDAQQREAHLNREREAKAQLQLKIDPFAKDLQGVLQSLESEMSGLKAKFAEIDRQARQVKGKEATSLLETARRDVAAMERKAGEARSEAQRAQEGAKAPSEASVSTLKAAADKVRSATAEAKTVAAKIETMISQLAKPVQPPASPVAPAPTPPRESPVTLAINAEAAVIAKGRDVEQVLRSAEKEWSQMQATLDTALGASFRGRIEGLERQAQKLHSQAQAELAALPKPKAVKKPTQEVADLAEAHGRVTTATQRVADLSDRVSAIAEKARAWKPPEPPKAPDSHRPSDAKARPETPPTPSARWNQSDGAILASMAAIIFLLCFGIVYLWLRLNDTRVRLFENLESRAAAPRSDYLDSLQEQLKLLERNVGVINSRLETLGNPVTVQREIASVRDYPQSMPTTGSVRPPSPPLPPPPPPPPIGPIDEGTLLRHVMASRSILSESRRSRVVQALAAHPSGLIEAEIVLPASDGWRLAVVFAKANRNNGLVVPLMRMSQKDLSDWFMTDDHGEFIEELLHPAMVVRDHDAALGWRPIDKGKVRCVN